MFDVKEESSPLIIVSTQFQKMTTVYGFKKVFILKSSDKLYNIIIHIWNHWFLSLVFCQKRLKD